MRPWHFDIYRNNRNQKKEKEKDMAFLSAGHFHKDFAAFAFELYIKKRGGWGLVNIACLGEVNQNLKMSEYHFQPPAPLEETCLQTLVKQARPRVCLRDSSLGRKSTHALKK